MAYDVSEEIPSATAVLNIGGVKDKVDVIFQGEIFAHQTNFSFTLSKAERYIFFHNIQLRAAIQLYLKHDFVWFSDFASHFSLL